MQLQRCLVRAEFADRSRHDSDDHLVPNDTRYFLAETQEHDDFPSSSTTDETSLLGADLAKANLTSAFLPNIDLTNTNLRGAILVGANLEGANLINANLKSADLAGTNFRNADLTGANLEGVNFRGADLRDANLEGANFTGAILQGTNLEGANLEGTRWSNWIKQRPNCKRRVFSGCSGGATACTRFHPR